MFTINTPCSTQRKDRNIEQIRLCASDIRVRHILAEKRVWGGFFSNIYTIIFRWMSLKLSWIHDEHSVFSLSLKTSVIVELSLHKLYIASNLYFIESFLFKCENNISSVIIDIDFLIFRVKWDGKPTIVEAIGQNIKEMCVTSAYVK